jgi:hypothetical protein
MDLVFFAGPVILRPDFQSIDWEGRDVRIVPIVGEGSANFSALADSLASGGSILDGMFARYAKVPISSVERIAVCAYSAGHGLMSKLLLLPHDRARIDAVVLSDACYDSLGTTTPKPGYLAYALEAADGAHRMVSTTGNTTDGGYLSAAQSWGLVFDAVEAQRGPASQVTPPSVVPAASGGWWRRGELFWGNYTAPGSPPNSGNDFTHGGQHDLAPRIWQGYLAPWFARSATAPYLLAGAAVGGLAWLATSVLGAGAWALRRRS